LQFEVHLSCVVSYTLTHHSLSFSIISSFCSSPLKTTFFFSKQMTKDRKVQVPQNTNTPAAPVAAASKAVAPTNQPAAGREKAGKNKEDKKKKNAPSRR
jgi:hypothetical protein